MAAEIVVSNNIQEIHGGKLTESRLKEKVLQHICALLNHADGGTLVLNFPDRNRPSREGVGTFVRGLEQNVQSKFGLLAATSRFSFISKFPDKIEFKVTAQARLSCFSICSNLFLPSYCQVLLVSPAADNEVISHILNENRPIAGLTQLKPNTDWTFVKGEQLLNPPEESDQVQFKSLKAEKTSHVSLADRIINNRLASCVSAFANKNGGRILYGIRDDAVVEGEVVEEPEKQKITRKVAKEIRKMIWPMKCGTPKKGEHWDIDFQQVVDADGKVIPSTFVIVASIAACPGGVFTKEPESYVLGDLGGIERLGFDDWKEKHTITTGIVHCVRNGLANLRNGQDSETFDRTTEAMLKLADEMKLVVLHEQAAVADRKGDFEDARRLNREYNEVLATFNAGNIKRSYEEQ